MQQEKDTEGNTEQNDSSGFKSRAFKLMEERQERRRRRASLGRLIFYIVMLIGLIFLMFWFRGRGL